jgi:hypothetical protein
MFFWGGDHLFFSGITSSNKHRKKKEYPSTIFTIQRASFWVLDYGGDGFGSGVSHLVMACPDPGAVGRVWGEWFIFILGFSLMFAEKEDKPLPPHTTDRTWVRTSHNQVDAAWRDGKDYGGDGFGSGVSHLVMACPDPGAVGRIFTIQRASFWVLV